MYYLIIDMETNKKKINKLKVISEPFYPDIDWDKFREDFKRLKVLGLEDIDFQFDDGVEISYNAETLTLGMQIEGEKTLCFVGETSPVLKFGYGPNLDRLLIKDNFDNILLDIESISEVLNFLLDNEFTELD